MTFKASLFFLIILLTASAFAQVPKDSELFEALKKNDSLLFDAGFNNCEISAFEHLIGEDLEFYHDQGGLTTNKEDFLNNVRNNICSSPDKKPIRKLDAESLEVFPLYSNGKLYGAIQKGRHDFFIKEPGKELYQTSSALFTHVWLLEDEKWTLKRVLSYDHQ
ncbi:nuclear transport factor 2 family protein [Salinimicrobium xinjiangense]|uniref:nuclear transport factor 2 family protein n=1 Tax=Salinimicrobium xinjiangense TaxID=438596 RepID=UPI000405915C|nr:nuclear transport factor 2 family protein [Salinimicrobium xinjiangense]